MSEPVNVDEVEQLARASLTEPVYDYYAGGADDEVTVRANREAFRSLALRYRVLVDVAKRDTTTTLFGIPLPFPLILAPTALHRLAHPDGELATARGAAETGTLMTLSTISSTPLEDVAQAAPGPKWFQLYHFSHRALSEKLIERAHAAGYQAIVVTADVPVLGRREKDLRHPFVLPDGIEAVHLKIEQAAGAALGDLIHDSSLSWDDLAWIREASPLPVIIKGIVRADDAKRALDEGVDGLWVSNHGGRQLDTSIASAAAIPDIAAVVAGRVPIIVDGGVRRGTDILKAIALGADAVAVGRPQLWGLTVGGAEGVARVIRMLHDEFSLAMALAGSASVAEIDASLIDVSR